MFNFIKGVFFFFYRADTQSQKSLTIDARTLQGETFRVSMRKGAKGFGFTIVGGEQPGEVLQVNNIVRGGAADIDGRLRTGDIIMRLNGRNVLSWSHSDIIRFLQQTRVRACHLISIQGLIASQHVISECCKRGITPYTKLLLIVL